MGQRRPSPVVGWLGLALALLCVALTAAPVARAQEAEAPDGEHGPGWSSGRGATVAAQTPRFDVLLPPGSPFAARADALAAVLERVLPTVEARLETRLADRVSLLVLPADAAPAECPPRAAAIPSRRRLVLFAGPETLEPRALDAFLAHELGHQLTYDRWGGLGGDRRLAEGLATWAAEPYWLIWRGWPALDPAVADLLAAQAVAPLAAAPQGCLLAAQRDVYYSAWASFVDYLLRRYGWDRLGMVVTLPSAADDEADYTAAYGQPVDALATAWEQDLHRGP